MADNPYTMSNKEAEEFLKGGGRFEAMGGKLRVVYAPAPADRYLILNETGNGGEYVQTRYSAVQDLAEQLVGGLDQLSAVEPEAGGG